MATVVISAALWDKTERAPVPSTKPLGLELLGPLPGPLVVIGAVQIEDDRATFGELVSIPFERLAGSCSDRREERIEPTNLLDEAVGVSVIFDLQPFSGCSCNTSEAMPSAARFHLTEGAE